MKKLLITVNGKRYEVDVEVVEEDDVLDYAHPRRVQPLSGYVTPGKTTAPRSKSKTMASDGKSLTAPINGVILEIPVAMGQTVAVNDVLVVLEAMKMKTNISSPHAGKIKTINVKIGETIVAGQVLLTFE